MEAAAAAMVEGQGEAPGLQPAHRLRATDASSTLGARQPACAPAASSDRHHRTTIAYAPASEPASQPARAMSTSTGQNVRAECAMFSLISRS